MILVNKPFLPPQEEFNTYTSQIWESRWLTNDGPLVQKLQNRLTDFLKVRHLSFVNNGTNALMLAIKALELKGEIITTPFSFVATTSSIVWQNCTPVFVDIDSHSLNIDVSNIEKAITKNTSAILATHVYGNPCNVKAIEAIATKYHLKVIYDAAHAFGIEVEGKSIFEYGDISICSTHATKVFHTTEGGFLVTKSEELFKKLERMKNFGFKDYKSFSEIGINAKNSEFHAAMGLVNLKYQEQVFKKRKELTELYDKQLFSGNFKIKEILNKQHRNYSYYSILFEFESDLLEIQNILEKNKIYTRRYFYPSLTNSLPYLKSERDLQVVNEVAKKVLCLPLYFDLKLSEVDLICKIIKNILIKKSLKPSLCQ